MPNKLICDRPKCSASFGSEHHLKRHINTVHKKQRPYVCHRTNCGASFGSDHHLKRHINTVHEKKRPYVCHQPKCGASFGSEHHLKRHSLSVHIKKRNFNCSQCPKAFNTPDESRVHERNVHGAKIGTSCNTIRIEKPSYECAECGRNFVTKSNLVRHIFLKHGDKEYFECHTCGCRYKSKRYLEKHIFEKHSERIDCMSIKKSILQCIICKKSFQYRYQVENHYQEFHHITLDIEKHTFPTMQDFLNWKQNIEDSTITRFRLRSQTKWKFVYVCHRSGPILVKLFDRKRANSRRGSKKLDGMCPASITLLLDEKDSSCVATFLKTHVGHESNDVTELKHCFLRKEDRNKLAEMVASGIPKRRILGNQSKICTDYLYNFVTVSDEDLCTVEYIYDVKSHENFIQPHERDDAENLERNMVSKMIEKIADTIKNCPLEELEVIGNYMRNLEAALQSVRLNSSLPLVP